MVICIPSGIFNIEGEELGRKEIYPCNHKMLEAFGQQPSTNDRVLIWFIHMHIRHHTYSESWPRPTISSKTSVHLQLPFNQFRTHCLPHFSFINRPTTIIYRRGRDEATKSLPLLFALRARPNVANFEEVFEPEDHVEIPGYITVTQLLPSCKSPIPLKDFQSGLVNNSFLFSHKSLYSIRILILSTSQLIRPSKWTAGIIQVCISHTTVESNDSRNTCTQLIMFNKIAQTWSIVLRLGRMQDISFCQVQLESTETGRMV
jgi:hypothetical protein